MPRSQSNGPSCATRPCGPTSSQQVDEWRAALVGTVAHDLRTPLASIKVAVSDLREPGLALGEAARSDLLETIEEQTDRLTRLVSTVLDLWRLEAGALRPRSASSSRWTTSSTKPPPSSNAPSTRPGCAALVPADLPPLEVDPVLMAQVLANLLENAARHSPAGLQIRVEAAKHRPGSADEVEIAVSDSGPGVPPDQRELIFEMFHRGTDGGSAGLGLAIAKAFVEAQGGRIGVEAARGGGARFVLTVPAVAVSSSAAAASRRGRVTFVTRVLVVDDDPALLRALRIGLDARGFEVIVAHTGAEGLSRAAQPTPDVIVLDLGLPDLDGVEVCEGFANGPTCP